MKKLISLAVALAMVVSVAPAFGLTAMAAATEPYVLFDAATAINEGDYHGDIELNKYRWTTDAAGVKFSTQWSALGTWNTAPWGEPALMFFREQTEKQGTDETKSATVDNADITEGATRIVIEFKFAMQTDKDNYQYWYFKDLDGKTFAQLHYDKNGPCEAGISSPVVYASDSAAATALCGTSMKIEAVEGESDWTVTYTSGSEVVCTEKIDSINGFKSIQAVVKEWCKQYKAMGLMGLKITADVDPANIATVTVRTKLSDGADPGVEDVSFDVRAGKEFTYVPNSTAPIKVGDSYYTYNAEDTVLTINPTAEGENLIELKYDKFEGAGITGSVIADGATCWFADPRTLTVKGEGGENITYIGYIDNMGNVRATQYDNNTGLYEEVLVRSNLQPDDHNNPAFLELPDHHIMIIYSRHTDEKCFYYRISKEPYDITTLAGEKRLATDDSTTYPNPFILEDDKDHIYMGWRGIDWHPTFAQLDMPDADNDYTLSFTWGPKQIVRSNIQGATSNSCRPYAKYASDGKNKIWITYTGTHPDNVGTNPIYCNYIDITDFTLHDVSGAQLQDLDDGRYTVSGSETDAEAQVVFRENNVRGWVWEIALAEDSYPVIAMVKIDSSKTKHDYWLAHYDGSSWVKTDLPDPAENTYFHETPNVEMCYSGGMSIDKADTHVIYASAPVNGVFGKVWEIFKYTLSSDYSTVTGNEQITENSVKDNARPYVAQGSAEGDLRLTWFNGDYYYWIHSNQNGGLGYPVQMMTITNMEPLSVDNSLDEGDGRVSSLLNETELTAAPASDSFTISLNLLQNDMADEGTLLESGNLKIELEKQTVDDTYSYAAVAPKITVGEKTEKSQNLFSDSAWYFNLGGTGGSKGQSPLGWINYVVTYDAQARELVTYVNGLIDATVQGVDVTLDDTVTANGLLAAAADVRTANVALTQAEVRAEAEKFDEAAAQAEADKIFDNFDYDMLDIPTKTVTDLILPSKTNGGENISWTSNNEAVIANNGAVTRDAQAHEVELTAAFGEKTKKFTVTVPAKVDVMAENIVVHYNFDDVKDSIVPDLSANGYNAEVKGTAAKFDNGKLDLTANTADGWDTNGYLNVPFDFMKDVRSYSVVEQISGGADRNDPRLYDFGKNTGNSVFTRLNTVGGNNQYQAGLKYNNENTQMVAGGPILTGEYWLVTTYSAATGETKVYTVTADGLNTVAEGNNVVHEPYEISGSTDRNYIGRTQWSTDTGQRGNNQDFNGTIDNFMFFNTALSTDEITAITQVKTEVEAKSSLRIADNADGTVSLGLSFTAVYTGDGEVTEAGFEYAVNEKAEDGSYTKAGAAQEVKFDSLENGSFTMGIAQISDANCARTYTARPYVVVGGVKIYGETVEATLYGALADSIMNATGASISPARLIAVNRVISFVKANRGEDSETKFPGLAEATAKLYDAEGNLNSKAVALGITDDGSALQLAESLGLESVDIEFVDTEIDETAPVDKAKFDYDFVPEL